MHFRRLTGILAVGILGMGAVFADDADDVRQLLRADGQSAEAIQKFESAVEHAEEDESLAPLQPYLESRSAVLSFVAGIEALSLDPEAAVETICAAVESGKGNVPALLMTLSFDHERATIAWLIGRLQSNPPDEQKRAIVFSLQVLTAQTYTEASEWAKWWAGDGKKFRPEPLVPQEQQARMQAAAASLRIDLVKGLLAKLKSTAPAAKPGASPKSDPLAPVTKMFEDMAKTMELGRNLRLSAPAKAGDAAFSEGNLDKAAADYAAAVAEDPGDLRSRYLRACILLETGKPAAARAEFEDIATQSPEVTSAKFLAQVCERRQQNAAEPMADAALNVWREFHPKPELGFDGWGDPVTATLMGQTMTGGGIFHVPVENLDMAKHPDEPNLAVGAALIGANALRIPALDRVLEKSPTSTAALAARALSALHDADKAAVPGLLDRLARQDPDNAFPLLLKIAMQNQLPREQKSEPKKHPLSAAVIAETAATLRKRKFDSYRALLRAVGMEALHETGHPFHMALVANATKVEYDLLQFLFRLSTTATADFETGNDKQGREILGLLEEIDRRTVEAKEPIMAQLSTVAAVGIAKEGLLKFEKKSGDNASAANLKKELEEVRSRQPKSAQTRWMAMLLLPVPSLQNELGDRMAADEMGLTRSQPVEVQ